jgi:iron complex transport system substrate-binding protein
MYALAPDLMVGRVTLPRSEDDRFLPPVLRSLPVLGATHFNASPEAILKANPQVLIFWDINRNPADDKINARFESMGVPYVFAYGNEMSDYPAVIRFLGQLTGREKRAEALARYSEKTLARVGAAVKTVPPAQRPRVYYAQSADGLSTDCADSFHTSMLRTLGDVNVLRCHAANGVMQKISLEEVIAAQPDVIVAQDRNFVEHVAKGPAWSQVKAVREGRVYLIPKEPLNWMDTPPSVMRFLGVQWLASILYPKQFPLDQVKTTQEFFQLFFDVKLTPQDVHSLLRP